MARGTGQFHTHAIVSRKGFEFVEMPDCQAAQAAIVGLWGQEFAGRTLTVSEAKGRATHRAPRRAGRHWQPAVAARHCVI
jgi:RNA recognition motif-containing protein